MVDLRSAYAMMSIVQIELVTGDITAERVDAIVNAANWSLLGGGGVDGAIHRKGGPAILDECRALRASRYGGGLPVGEAVATTAGRLAARWVIHTVGPRHSATDDRSPLLRRCYHNSLTVAADLGATSVAFPLISSGVYRWPTLDAAIQALTALQHPPPVIEIVRLVLFDEDTRQVAERAWQMLFHPRTDHESDGH
jgi:O-acetyl-ADP-ribose deacetylase (regulator of RNase III)